MHPKDALGAHGEDLATAHLIEAGLRVLDRNWRCPIGELDIVAREGNTLVFCEVKTRRSNAFGDPAEAVNWKKSRKLRQLAAKWLSEHDEHAREIRFDVVAVLAGPAGPPSIRHLRAAL